MAPQPIDAFMESPLRQLLVSLVTLKIAGILLIFDVSGLQAFDLPKSLFSRAVEWAMVGVIGALLVRYGLVIVPRTGLHLIAAGVVLASATSALSAENQFLALYGDRDRYMGLTFVLDMAVLYLAVAVAFRRDADWVAFATGVGAACVVLAAYAWIQFLGADPIVWSDDPATRPFSTLGHPDHIGHVLSVMFGAAVAVAALGGAAAARPLGVALCFIALGTAAVVATRGTLLGVAAALGVLPLVVLRAGRELRAAAAAGVLAVAAGVLLTAGALLVTPLGERLQSGRESIAIDSRFALFDLASRAFMARPRSGYGPDNFSVAVAAQRERDDARVLGEIYYGSAHNWLFHAAATTGAIGLVAALALAFGSLAALWRHIGGMQGRVCAGLFVASVAYWTHGLVAVGSNSIDWVPWVALGGAASVSPVVSTLRRRAGWLAATLATVLVITGVATGVATGVSVFTANREALITRTLVQTATASVDPSRAIAAAEAAVARDHGRSELWTWLGIAYGTANRWSDAATAYEEAAARSPHEWLNWANIARARTRNAAGSTDAIVRDALPAARRAVAVDPNLPSPNIVLSETLFAAGAYDEALASAVVAVLLDPTRNFDGFITRPAARATDLQRALALLDEVTEARSTAPLHVAFAQLALRLGDTSTARSEAMRALQLAPGNADALAILRATGG